MKGHERTRKRQERARKDKKGQERTRKDKERTRKYRKRTSVRNILVFSSFLNPNPKKTPFLTDYQERTRKGQKGQGKDKKGREKEKGFIFADLFQKGQKGQYKTKNIKGPPLGFYTR